MSRVIAREASELGWKPGERPRTINIMGLDFHHAHTTRDREGEVMYDEYHPSPLLRSQYPNTILQVFND